MEHVHRLLTAIMWTRSNLTSGKPGQGRGTAKAARSEIIARLKRRSVQFSFLFSRLPVQRKSLAGA